MMTRESERPAARGARRAGGTGDAQRRPKAVMSAGPVLRRVRCRACQLGGRCLSICPLDLASPAAPRRGMVPTLVPRRGLLPAAVPGVRVAALGLRISQRHEFNGTKSLARNAVTLPPACIRGIMGLKGTRTDSARTLAESISPAPAKADHSCNPPLTPLLHKLLVDFPSCNHPSKQAHDPPPAHTMVHEPTRKRILLVRHAQAEHK